MLTRSMGMLLWALIAGVPAAWGQAATTAERAALERAVADHQAGRLVAARKAFEALDRRGIAAATFNLGVMQLQARKSDPQAAAALIERAARAGFVTAQFALAQMHENGQLGPRDLRTAHQWYERAARRGSVDAQVAAGTAYYLGRGAPKSAALAARWYLEAATRGDVGAMYLIASMYEQGDGVARDEHKAREWYARAAAQGDRLAGAKVRQIDAAEAALSV